MLVTTHGHAALVVETDANRILFDPGVFSTSWLEEQNLTALVITHAHADHFNVEGIATLLAAQPGVRVLADVTAAQALEAAGISAEIMTVGTPVQLGDDVLEPVGGQHACIHEDLPSFTNTGVVLRSGGIALFHPGDDIETVPAGIDVLALPLSAPWGSLSDTVTFLRRVNPSRVIGIHDALLSDLGRRIFLDRIMALGPQATELLAPEHGVALPISL